MAREHLKDVFGKAFGRRKDVDDTNEILSYKASVHSLLIGLIVMGTWLHTAIGGGFMAFLMFMRYRFLWWPIHPVAYPISAVCWMEQLWFSIFIAWIIKSVLTRYGGNKVYKASKPFFLGLILGQLVAAGLWFVIDLITGHTGNMVFWI